MTEESTVRITETEDGPLVIDGQIKLIDARRVELETHGKVRLCRCGMSNSKLFCATRIHPQISALKAGNQKKNFSARSPHHDVAPPAAVG